MPLDPESADFLELLQNSKVPSFEEMSPADARKLVLPCRGDLPEVAKTEDRQIEGKHGSFDVRVYWPNTKSEGPLPALVYFHGGGWVVGNIEAYDGLCRLLSSHVGCVVVSVDYHLAPEFKYPAAPDDCYSAVEWVHDSASELNVDIDRIAVGGDSAGGNLSAAVSLMAEERGGPKICYQVLVYPITDYSTETDSYKRNGEDYFLTTSVMEWFWDQYLTDPEQAKEVYASPYQAADLSGQPPALILVAEYDPLYDDGINYGKRLEEAGVPVDYIDEAGMIHGYLRRIDVFKRATQSATAIGDKLLEVFSQ